MKALLAVLVAVVIGASAITGVAFAQGDTETPQDGIDVANFFSWATSTPPQYDRGALYGGLGLAGALVTLFGLVGGAIPGTAGKARIDITEARVEAKEKGLDELREIAKARARAGDAIDQGLTNAIEKFAEDNSEARADLKANRRNQFLIGGVLYAVLGAFFAALIAQDIFQALTIGVSWTAVAGNLGLRKSGEERKSETDNQVTELMAQVKELERTLTEARETSQTNDTEGLSAILEPSRIDRIIRKAEAAGEIVQSLRAY